MSDANFWKRKLLAYLHDPPSKCLDLGAHIENAQTLMRQAGFGQEEATAYNRPADHTASAADRLPFPGSRSSGLSCTFDGVRACFHHPLSGHKLRIDREFASAELAFETDQTIQPVVQATGMDEKDLWRARFFAHWRLYPRNARERDYRFAFLPADTRLPDHTVWTHMQVVSALAGCAHDDEPNSRLLPAFLRFQIGPVQEFIAQARSIRDLWSGSYLLSWLVAAGVKAVSAEVGPDAIVFPNLLGQPLFDLHWRDDLWSKISIGGKSCWDSIRADNADLLIPNLPNTFLAIVPGKRACELGRIVEKVVGDEWKTIADAVWKKCQSVGLIADEAGLTAAQRKVRFDAQVERFLSVSWVATPWPETIDSALAIAHKFAESMPIQAAAKHVGAIKDWAEKTMPAEHRDSRYYIGGESGPKNQLNNLGLGWSLLNALNSWQLDAVRQNRAFSAWAAGGWNVGTFSNKDSLNGREEAVAGGKKWQQRAEKIGGVWKSLFKKDDWQGASALIKRVWHLAYLDDVRSLRIGAGNFPMPNTRGVAAHQPFIDEGEEDLERVPDSEKYFAVLAFDGDAIGEWVSGARTPMFSTQLAAYRDGSNVQDFGSKPYFERHGKQLLTETRPVSPSYHLQFSEALGNFALKCARQIVETYDGRLIYAGGDDVLALVPADVALACAEALVLAFRGNADIKTRLQADALRLRSVYQGFRPVPDYQKLAAESKLLGAAAGGFLYRDDIVDTLHKHPVPFLAPGPAASASVGIAIAHFKSSLQDVVREARSAERRAKTALGKAAVAVTLMKRSGEIRQWGCKWDSRGLEAFNMLMDALREEIVSVKFPYRVIELLNPYLADDSSVLGATKSVNGFGDIAGEIISREVRYAAARQRGRNYQPDGAEEIVAVLLKYLENLEKPQQKLWAAIGLCETVAFANRTRPESDSSSQSNGTV